MRIKYSILINLGRKKHPHLHIPQNMGPGGSHLQKEKVQPPCFSRSFYRSSLWLRLSFPWYNLQWFPLQSLETATIQEARCIRFESLSHQRTRWCRQLCLQGLGHNCKSDVYGFKLHTWQKFIDDLIIDHNSVHSMGPQMMWSKWSLITSNNNPPQR